jgi:hypothetical protein
MSSFEAEERVNAQSGRRCDRFRKIPVRDPQMRRRVQVTKRFQVGVASSTEFVYSADRPPNCPPTEVFLMLKSNFLEKIFTV